MSTYDRMMSAIELAKWAMEVYQQECEREETNGFSENGFSDEDFRQAIEDLGLQALVLLPGGQNCMFCKGTGKANIVHRRP